MMREHQKRAVITGVSSGFGAGAARAFADKGYRVWGTMRDVLGRPFALALLFSSACAGRRDYGYEFVCANDGLGLSIVDVLEASGEHQTFLDLMSRYDPGGLEILTDPVLADKTLWAPTDAAISATDELLSSLPDDEIMAILGYHITPPRRTPEGPYPIITPQFLIDGGWMVHQTRTGILTGSDQRVLTRIDGDVLTVEDSTILPTAWCTQTGSVFSINAVITDASPEPWLD